MLGRAAAQMLWLSRDLRATWDNPGLSFGTSTLIPNLFQFTLILNTAPSWPLATNTAECKLKSSNSAILRNPFLLFAGVWILSSTSRNFVTIFSSSCKVKGYYKVLVCLLKFTDLLLLPFLSLIFQLFILLSISFHFSCSCFSLFSASTFNFSTCCSVFVPILNSFFLPVYCLVSFHCSLPRSGINLG